MTTDSDTMKANTVLEAIKTLARERYVFMGVPVENDSKLYQLMTAENAYLALWNIINHQEIRNLLKHGGANEKFKTPEDALEWVRNEVLDIVEEYGIDLERGTG